MESKKKHNWLRITGAVLILIGALSIFPENNSWIHTTLQIIFITGCIIYLIGNFLLKKGRNSAMIFAVIILGTIPNKLVAQEYNQQIAAFEKSFYQKDISIIKPYLSDSLIIAQLPVQNTIPILTNIVTKLPTLIKIQLLQSENDKAKVEYDFEQLGLSESYIHFDSNGKIKKIDFVDNLVKQQIEQQRKMQSSVQAPQPDKITFNYRKKKVEFPSKDGLTISADLYEIDPSKPFVLLLHQAGYNKYEYADIAPRLNALGFNALAIDQRSGGDFANNSNETHNRAIQNGDKNIEFTDAIQDIESAVDYLAEKYQQKIIVWGSSYSSSLALHIAEKNKNVKAVISFSPGDYFGSNLPSLETVFPKIDQPLFVTSSRDEASDLKGLLNKLKLNNLQTQFIPESDGFHGSRAVWIGQKGANEYWTELELFLSKVKEK